MYEVRKEKDGWINVMNQNQLEMVRTVVLLGCLGLMSIEDIRKREISSMWIILLGVIGVPIMTALGEFRSALFLIRFVPGVVCVMLAWVTREQIGYGDALLLLVLGFYLDVNLLMNVCMVAMTLVGILSLVLLVVAKQSRKSELPLIPFILLGYLVVWWWNL